MIRFISIIVTAVAGAGMAIYGINHGHDAASIVNVPMWAVLGSGVLVLGNAVCRALRI